MKTDGVWIQSINLSVLGSACIDVTRCIFILPLDVAKVHTVPRQRLHGEYVQYVSMADRKLSFTLLVTK